MSVILWLVLGGLVFYGFYFAANKYKLTWYEWVLAVLGVILVLFSIQNYGAYGAEFEPRAATNILLLFGLPGLILAFLGFWLPSRR